MDCDQELRAKLAAAHARGDWTEYAVLRAKLEELSASRARLRAKSEGLRLMYLVCTRGTAGVHLAHSIHPTRAAALRWLMQHGLRTTAWIELF